MCNLQPLRYGKTKRRGKRHGVPAHKGKEEQSCQWTCIVNLIISVPRRVYQANIIPVCTCKFDIHIDFSCLELSQEFIYFFFFFQPTLFLHYFLIPVNMSSSYNNLWRTFVIQRWKIIVDALRHRVSPNWLVPLYAQMTMTCFKLSRTTIPHIHSLITVYNFFNKIARRAVR